MLQEIYKGAAPNDKTGTPARPAAQIINDNFAYLDNKITRKDSIVVSTGSTKSGVDITYNAYWQWIIDTIDYTNPVDVVISVPLASSGFLRLDLIALTTSNTFVRIPGTESESDPQLEALPDNMLQAGFVLVTDSEVGDPSSPIIGDKYYTKPESDAALALKLDVADYHDRFKGVYPTLSALNTAHPTANAGDSAQVNEVGSTLVVNYSWDAESSVWVEGGSGGSGAINTDMLPEGSSNLYFTTARVLATLLTGISFVTGGAIVATDSVLVALGKLQKQISDILASSSLAQISISTSVSITTATTDGSGNSQYGKHVLIKNGVNNINITTNGVSTTPTTYQKEGAGTITFVQGSGRTLRQVDGTAILNGAVGSTASLSSDGTTDSLRISNA